ncbi:MAG: hypothetical protein L6Q98_04615 [Anaerolineae bacterium]|nr:hypothetical protein [Anaerolineae bacterium]NUQ03507.1 hypothetical protein [Anaerolineae bacterium]
MSQTANETPRSTRSRYERPRRPFSILGMILGLILGIGGTLAYTWLLAPVEAVDITPWQMDSEGRAAFTAAVALAYAQDGDLPRAVERLVSLRFPGDPIQGVADVACQLASTGYVNSSSGLQAVRAMMHLYQLQGRSGCADQLIPAGGGPIAGVVELDLPTPTITLTPPPSKTPTPSAGQATPTPLVIIVPTSPPQNDFVLVGVTTACSLERPGVIVVEVYEANGATGIPGMEVRARWNGGESRFFTGLKPGRGAAYSDFQMDSGIDYLIDLPGRADPIQQPLSAVPCTTPNGDRSVISYRVVFRQAA